MKPLLDILTQKVNTEKTVAPLVYYVRMGNLDKVQELLKQGEDPNQKSEDFRNPLALSFATQRLDLAKVLLENRANPNLLCGRVALGFIAPIIPKDSVEEAWLYNKEAYDLLKAFGTDFSVRDSSGEITLEEYFAQNLPSTKLKNSFK